MSSTADTYDPVSNTILLTIWPQEIEKLDFIARYNDTTRDIILRLFIKEGLERSL